MKNKIFTFLILMLCLSVAKAQPLSSSQLPDTIRINYRTNVDERFLIQYNPDKTRSKTVKQKWDSLSNDFKFNLDTSFTYFPNSKISGFTTSDDYTANYYYHSNNTDSLRLIYFKNKLVQRTTYNSDGNLTSYKTWIIVADTLQSQGGNYYFYNQNGKIQKAETSFFLNGKKAYNSEFNYEYDNLARLVFSNRRQKNFTIADTTWKWILKAEYKYLDEDDKYDEVLSYQSNANGWYATGKTVFIYTPLELKQLFYNPSNILTRQGSTTFNDKGQMLVSKNELLSNQIWVIGSQDDYFYRSDGSLSLYQSRLHDSKHSTNYVNFSHYKYLCSSDFLNSSGAKVAYV
jgi:hypothetical protein